MLSPADRELTLREQALPGLALLLDPLALRAWLQARWPGLAIGELEPIYLRYKPGTSCLAGFRLDVDRANVWLALTARRRDAADKFDKALLKTGVPGPFGLGRFVFPEMALTMACFPNDRALPALPRLFDRSEREGLWARLGLPGEASLLTLHIRPERRYAARVEHAGNALAVLKLHAAKVFARCLRNASAFASSGPLVVPRLIGASPPDGAIACAWLEGAPAALDAATAQRIGEALAALHAQPAPGLAELSAARQRASAAAMAEDIAALVPALADRAQALAQRIAQALADDAPKVALHGDCHRDQILDLGARIALVDFDEAARGPAGWDLGNLLAHLVAEDLAPPLVSHLRLALLDGYRAAGGVLCDRDLGVQTALALLRLATRPFRERRRDWPAAMAALLGAAEASCPGARAAAPLDPALPRLADALDPATARAALAEAGLTADVASARMLRHKPGRRCLIAYELVEPSGRRLSAIAKMRAKGADCRTFAVQKELWNTGFSAEDGAAVQVAAPLALVPALDLWLQALVPGRAFTPESCTPGHLAAALAALHRSPLRPLRRHSLADELAILSARLAALAERRQEWRERLAALLSAARRVAAQALPVQVRPIHRDCHPGNLLCDGETLYLLDLDLVCLGDPAIDIGNFSAHLTESALREHRDPEHFASWQARFLQTACRGPFGAQAINARIYEFLTLLRLIEIAERMPERRASAPILLVLCEARAEPANALTRRWS